MSNQSNCKLKEFIICPDCKGWHEKGNYCQDDYFEGIEGVMP